MFLKVLFFLPAIFGNAQKLSATHKSVIDDFYWRDLRGDIPIDALPGGFTATNETTYIGEVLHANNLRFGEIRSDGIILFQLYDQVIVDNEHLKILCTKHPERFHWKTVRNELDFKKLDQNRLIAGNIDIGTCYVGRAHYHNGVVVGNVCFDYKNNFIFNGATGDNLFKTKTFQVLFYDPELIVNSSNGETRSMLLLLVVFITYKFL